MTDAKKTAVLLAIALVAWFVLTGVRTWNFGFQLGQFLTAAGCIFPGLWAVALLLWRGRSQRRAMAVALAGALICVGGSEAFASAQEVMLMRQHGRRPEKNFVVARWAPFRSSCLGYSTGYGWWGCD